MRDSGTYTCDCGKSYDNYRSFNGHKSHCPIHLSITGRLQTRLDVDQASRAKKSKTMKARKAPEAERRHQEQVEALNTWISEQHTCEKCGKIMTEKYGSGRFCCRSCANSRERSEELRQRLGHKAAIRIQSSDSYLTPSARLSRQREEEYRAAPTYCCICGAPLDYAHRERSTCSKKCKNVLASQQKKLLVQQRGGNLNPAPNKNCKSGIYKGIHCDSSWELAFVVYHLDHGIPVMRNTIGYPYEYQGEQHLYYPDFIVNGEVYEVKNHITDLVRVKAAAVPPGILYHIVSMQEIKPMLQYCCQKYGKNFWKVLYK